MPSSTSSSDARGVLRLLALVGIVVAAVAAFDRLVPSWLEGEGASGADRERVETFRHVVFRNFEQTQQSIEAAISRTHRRFDALPDEKPPGEIRVFVIGNSAALFAVAPDALGRRLASAYPMRDVRLVPLLIPDIGVRDERLLVRAALAKDADVVVLMPNLKGLILGYEIRLSFLRELFGDPGDRPPLRRPADVVRRWGMRSWQAFRARDELRARALRAVFERAPLADPRVRERAAIDAAFRDIERAAASGDVARLVATYRQHGMQRFIPDAMPPKEIPRDAPVFRVMGRTADDVREAGVLGVAIFLPVNPLFRDPKATGDDPEVRVDDATLRAIAARTLEIYRRAGFASANLLDALPPTAFIDLVHPNAQGMRSFTGTAATLTLRALAELEGREGRRLGAEGSSGARP